jgi:endonuclease YncB( thermonuclease family)
MNSKPLILGALFLLSCVFYYQLTANAVLETNYYNVTRVVDGDTVELEIGQKVRLLGINTPEKGFPYSNEATEFLSSKVLGKKIKIESYGSDKYGRILAHIFVDKEHVNEEILGAGLASLYYYEKDSYYDSMKRAEEFARINEKGIWKKSKNAPCLGIVTFQYEEKTKRCSNEETLTLENNCDYRLNLTIKDDATHIYKEFINSNSQITRNFSCIWNDEGDTIYISDSEGLLIFYRYE